MSSGQRDVLAAPEQQTELDESAAMERTGEEEGELRRVEPPPGTAPPAASLVPKLNLEGCTPKPRGPYKHEAAAAATAATASALVAAAAAADAGAAAADAEPRPDSARAVASHPDGAPPPCTPADAPVADQPPATEPPAPTACLLDLPIDLLVAICTHLPLEDLARAWCVCTHFARAAERTLEGVVHVDAGTVPAELPVEPALRWLRARCAPRCVRLGARSTDGAVHAILGGGAERGGGGEAATTPSASKAADDVGDGASGGASARLGPSASTIRELDLSGSSNLTDSGIRYIRRATGLRELNLSLCRYITDEGVADALTGAAFPSMTKVTSAWSRDIAEIAHNGQNQSPRSR